MAQKYDPLIPDHHQQHVQQVIPHQYQPETESEVVERIATLAKKLSPQGLRTATHRLVHNLYSFRIHNLIFISDVFMI